MAKQHGSLARAGKVKNQTPKVATSEKEGKPQGRAGKREKYNRRFLSGAYNNVEDGEARHLNRQAIGKTA